MVDLIDEASADLERLGYEVKNDKKFDIQIGRLTVDSQQKAEKLGFAKGQYVIVNSPQTYQLDFCQQYLVAMFGRIIDEILKGEGVSKGPFFIVGIGNSDILADSLGKRVVDKIDIEDAKMRIFKICPNIYLNTGIPTYDIVSILAKALCVECVIVIDSLATNNISRLATSFQFNSAGLTPGSALKQGNRRLDKTSLGMACLSIGVPFMIFASSLEKGADDDLILSPKDIHQQIEIASQIIADALNLALGGGR